MIVWSPSSWALWKQCPAKYRIKKVERWQHPGLGPDPAFIKLAVPGLVVDRLLQFWIYRGEYESTQWIEENFDFVWDMVQQQNNPVWDNQTETVETQEESLKGLLTAVRMLQELGLHRYQLIAQPRMFEQIDPAYAITGSADLLMLDYDGDEHILIDFKNAHTRERTTKDQLLIYMMGLERSLDITIGKAGYLLFNPRLEQWKWISMNPVHRERLKERMAEATSLAESGQFAFKYNYYSCSRFCDARFACERYKQGDQRVYESQPLYHI